MTAARSHTGLGGPVLPLFGPRSLRHVRKLRERTGHVSVGYKLYRLVRDFAPQDWTSGELVIALMIADSANEETLRSYIDVGLLNRRCRMSGRGVRKNLQKLADKGFEFRVSLGKDSTGKDIYGVPGKEIEYQVPDIFSRLERGSAVTYGLVEKLAEGGTAVPPQAGLSTEEGGTAVPARRYQGSASGASMP